MAAESNYYGIWLVYILSSLVFLSVYWRATRFPRWPVLARLRCLIIAVILRLGMRTLTGIRWRQR